MSKVDCNVTQGRLLRHLVALGGNIATEAGDPAQTIAAAVQAISLAGLVVAKQSRLFRTPSFPDPSDPDYVNACVEIQGVQDPQEVLDLLHGIETAFGRRRVLRWGSRTLDLDLLASDDLIRPDRAGVEAWMHLPPDLQTQRAPDRLILPHPRLHERAFVLVPLADIAPDWRHPVLGATVDEMLARLPQADRDAVRPIS